jgi:dihydroorotate dehydrogenase (NAD+) catalytic subunit
MKVEIELAPRHKSGLLLRNPVMLASGPSGFGVEYSKSAEIQRVGALVCAGVTSRAYAGADQPLLLETPSGLLSAFERPGPGLSKVLRSYADTWASWQTPVIVNLSGTSLDDFANMAARLDGVPGVAGLELNLASPDLAGDGAPFGSDPVLIARLIAVVRRASTLPIIAKLAPSAAGDLRPGALAAASAGVDALSLVHALPGLSIDVETRRPVLLGGLSGPAIKPLALRMLYDVAHTLRQAAIEIPLIGLGGISNARDALEFIMAGASAIQIGTIALVHPRAGVEIVEGLEAFLQARGIEDISEIVGAALNREKFP